MKEIVLSNGMKCLVDDDDFEALNCYKWQASFSNDSFRKTIKWYACRFETVQFKTRASRRKKIYMHRLLMNFPYGKVVDHIDSNGLNNQKYNLRIVTKRQNALNRILQGGFA
jgi:hypothetical protein